MTYNPPTPKPLNRSFAIVTFSADGFSDVKALLDETPPQIMGGHGGWTVTSRERRIGLTQWHGNDPLRLAIPILFDGGADLSDQMSGIATLGRMGLPPAGGGEPPVIYVKGKGIPDYTGKGAKQPWVIENLQWGTNVRREIDFSKNIGALRQDVVVNLLQYIDEDRVAFSDLAGAKPTGVTTSNRHGWPKLYTVHWGDTLPKIAAKFYKDSSKWKIIAKANNIRDPRNLPVGLIIRIPKP